MRGSLNHMPRIVQFVHRCQGYWVGIILVYEELCHLKATYKCGLGDGGTTKVIADSCTPKVILLVNVNVFHVQEEL